MGKFCFLKFTIDNFLKLFTVLVKLLHYYSYMNVLKQQKPVSK